jgi:hypothetical protein
MERDGQLFCDAPGCGAVTPAGGSRVSQWATLDEDDDAAHAHLCEVCVAKVAKDVLTDPSYLECARCGRSTLDGIDRWYSAPADPADWSGRRGMSPSINVCELCRRLGESFTL